VPTIAPEPLASADWSRAIPMNDAALMGEVQPVEQFDDEIEFSLQRHGLAQRDDVAQVTSFDQLHGDEELALGVAQIVDRHDVRVLNRPRRARLAQEPLLHLLRLAEDVAQELQGDVAPQDGVVRLPHDPHRPLADEGVELVLAEPAIALGFRHRVTQSYMRSR